MSDILRRFVSDTEHHVLTIAHDDGLYRHLQFRSEEWRPPLLHPRRSGMYWFDLITVPGALIFQGDGDSFVFHRLEDMFEFFRGTPGEINPGYWWEKVQDRRENVKDYDLALMKQHINEAVAEAVEQSPDKLSGLADRVSEDLIDSLSGDESFDRGLVEAFRFYANEADEFGPTRVRPDFEFSDTFEWRLRDYDWWYRWACHAIVWGIACYDAAKGEAPAPTLPKPNLAAIKVVDVVPPAAPPKVVTVELPPLPAGGR